ncbi:MAG TPA: T9SS type A sorting domain-containing protein, partial [Bacteroidota bacterium]|nr:T9SS type A sorting domain-containing protein [Bacteroidota bacterium]
LPSTTVLEQNYPNPFNPSTFIEFSLPHATNVTLKIYNILGQEVATLVDEYCAAGNYKVRFDASKLTSGVYVYRLKADSFVGEKKLLLLR